MLDKTQTLHNAPSKSGVYLMLNERKKIIYAGKANNIRNRLRSYFAKKVSIKTAQLVNEATHLRTIITASETESLLLEDRLIKTHTPKFNVLLRDDKTYPYLWFSDDEFALIGFRHRRHSSYGEYFGPYISNSSVRFTLDLLEKAFLLRTCSKSIFRNRTQPCLKHQIHCCSAPCVGLISKEGYKDRIKQAKRFLRNADFSIINELTKQMNQAAKEEKFELAVVLRDKISTLRSIQQSRNQAIISKDADVDVWGIYLLGNWAFMSLLQIRHGIVQASLPFSASNAENTQEALTKLLQQYYITLPASEIVPTLLVPEPIDEQIINYLQEKSALKKITVIINGNNELHTRWLGMVYENASTAAEQFSKKKHEFSAHLAEIALVIGVAKIETIECFDVSHFGGNHTVCAMTVCTTNGLQKSLYKNFTIKNAALSDDYGALQEAISRRMAYVSKPVKLENNKGLSIQPDILLIDGGVGQIGAAIKALHEQEISEQVILGIAKGPTRKAANERYFMCHYQRNDEPRIKEIKFASIPFALQILRDQSHNTAIRAMRKKSANSMQSDIASLSNIGKKRQQQLLLYFGSLAVLKKATVKEIAKVPGIGKKLAEDIAKSLENL